MMRIITIEEHITDAALDTAARKRLVESASYYGSSVSPGLPYFPDFEMYADMGELRIADMDASGIDTQVVSCPAQSQLLPAREAVPLTMDLNDRMAQAVKKHPGRFAAFASLPWSDPDAAAGELERAVKKLGFKGALLAGRPSAGDEFLDNPGYAPVLAAAAGLNVPIYLHPGCPIPGVQKPYYGGLGDTVSARLSLFGWGWHAEAGVQVVRMILAGVFEKFPKLQVISGHWGEMVPFYLSRLDQALPKAATGLSRTITETYIGHVYVTPSGIFTYPQLQFVTQALGADRIIHSVDFPLIGHLGAREFIENAPIAPADREKIAHGNAELLLGL